MSDSDSGSLSRGRCKLQEDRYALLASLLLIVSYAYKKSHVTGGSWSTPYNTRFFGRRGEPSNKILMAHFLAK